MAKEEEKPQETTSVETDVSEDQPEQSTDPPQDMNKNRMKMMGLIIASIVVAAAGTLLALNFASSGVSGQAAEVLSALDNLAQVDSGVVDFSVKVPADEDQGIASIDASGQIQFNTVDTLEALLDLDVTYDGVDFGAALAFVSPDILISVTGIDNIVSTLLSLDKADSANDAIFSSFSTYEDKWISVGSDSLEEFGLADIEETAPSPDELDETYDEVTKLIAESGAFDISSIDREMKLGETTLVGYLLSVTPEKVEQLVTDLASVGNLTDSSTEAADFTEMLKGLQDLFSDETGQLPLLELWTDGTYLRHFLLGQTDSDSFISVTLTELNSSPTIELPTADYTFDEVITEIFGLFLGLET